MTYKHDLSREELHEELIALVKKKLPAEETKLVGKFIHQYFATASLDDLLTHDLMDLYGAVLSHWNLVYTRKPGELKFNLYNPNIEEHGWQSTHTVIEIVQDDMPFLVDSIQMELNRRGMTTHLVIHVGGMQIVRDKEHRLIDISSPYAKRKNSKPEAVIFIEIDRQTDPATIEDLRNSILNILNDVRMAVEDWRSILHQVEDCIKQLQENPPPVAKEELDETIDFLRWIANDHFTFIGYREYELCEEEGDQVLQGITKTGLGVLRHSRKKKGIRSFAKMTPEARKLAQSSQILIIAKTNTKSTIHRPAYTDYIGVKLFDEKGHIIGERRFIGLYTSAAYNRSPRDIPLLRQKVETVMKDSHLSRTGHGGKALLNILENLPRDDLFQTDAKDLLSLAMGILHLQERRVTRLFVRKDIYGRFMSCLIYVPRDRYNTQLRSMMETILMQAFHGVEASFTTLFSESVLARIHYMIRIDPEIPLDYDVKKLEEKIIEVGRSWQDDVRDYLRENNGEERANELAALYLDGFPAGYIETSNPRAAVFDISHIESLRQQQQRLSMSLFKPLDESEETIRFKLFTINKQLPLSEVIPILENMGLKVIGEQPYRIAIKSGDFGWISDFSMLPESGHSHAVDKVRHIFQEAFSNIWFGEAENDGFNRLVLSAQLDWRQIAVLRAYAKYFRQIGFTFSQNYIEMTLAKYAHIARELVQLFELRFKPHQDERATEHEEQLEKQILADLEAVESLDEDRILRQYYFAIKATLRTNYYQVTGEGEAKSYLSFKLKPESIPEMPLPLPAYEIFVYSPRVEGVHLRSASVARGGLRWSDRREDFRTEVLGLMKAQRVKNAVIVPSGAKGGFVPKALPNTTNREEIMQEVVANYQTFIRGLLDVIDNIVDGQIITPENTVRYDDDDAYLVVAADKGTATFSNYANAISREYGFWLDDAFASGGITGYDHKAMGITAKGAWESVKRHFREMGLNTQTEDFTVVGIGDMAGDVFGNGMLLSPHIKLLAAFNHMHIFVDPDPDPAKSFAERQRLFDLPRSGWSDYNPELISAGGGVFSRFAKAIKLSPEIMQAFNIQKSIVVPNELIHAILTANVDLLWNGGIGTFVKATHETNLDVGDKTNDAIRVNATELNCRVIGEGGNLGMTQLSRVEYSLSGGICNTDFIDNSAGVDCSDHEVNIKILLNSIVANGDMTEKQRNTLLAEMTDDVSRLVLRNNYWQTQAMTIAVTQASRNLDLFSRLIYRLEDSGLLNRSLEFLPDEKEILERKSKGGGLTRPEIAVLLAYSKIVLKEHILASDVPEDPYISKIVFTAFPHVLNQRFAEQIEQHSLRREIIATQLSNAIINDMGMTFVNRVHDETGASVAAIIRAYVAVHDVFGMRELWNTIEALDYKVSSSVQVAMMTSLGRLIRRATRWFLSNYRQLDDIATTIAPYKAGIEFLYKELHNLLVGSAKESLEELINRYIDAGVPEAAANRIACTTFMFSVLDIIAATNEYDFEIQDVAKVYFTMGSSLELAWFRSEVIEQAVENHWELLAKAAFRDDIDWQQRELTIGVLQYKAVSNNADECIETWAIAHKSLVDRWHRIISDLRSSANKEFVMFAVALRGLLDLTQASMQAVKHLKVENE